MDDELNEATARTVNAEPWESMGRTPIWIANYSMRP
jgi:hypothetical protein